MTLTELRAQARARGLKGYSRMNKAALEWEIEKFDTLGPDKYNRPRDCHDSPKPRPGCTCVTCERVRKRREKRAGDASKRIHMDSAPRITHETWPDIRLALVEIAAESESGVKHGSLKWLRAKARDVGLRGRSRMNKGQLQRALGRAA